MKLFIVILTLILSISLSSAQREVRTYHDPIAQSKIKEIYFVNSKGQKNGSYKRFDSNGKMITKATFRNSFAHGKQEFWIGMQDNMECAKLPYSIKHYTNGEPSETWYEYGCNNGKRVLMLMEKYLNGVKVYYEKYTKDRVKIEGGYTINGKQESWYTNGQLANQIHVQNGKINGSYKQYYTNGQIGVDGIKKNGKWFGEKKEWFTNGNLKSEQKFVLGDKYGEIRQGKQIYYDSLGNKKKIEEYGPILNNAQRVLVELYYDSGELLSKWQQINSRTARKDIVFDGEYFTFHKNGKVAFNGKINENGYRHGIWKRYDEDGNVEDELRYLDGWRIGNWKIYYNDNWDAVDIKKQASYYRLIEFDEEGELSKGQIVIDYYINGVKQFEGGVLSIEPDILDGECVFYHKNGKIQAKGEMNNGHKSGRWLEYSEEGNLIKDYEYKVTRIDRFDRATDVVRTGNWIYYSNTLLDSVVIYKNGKLIETKIGDDAKLTVINIFKSNLIEICEKQKEGIQDIYIEQLVQGYYRTKKKNIYNAYTLLIQDYENQIKESNTEKDIESIRNQLSTLEIKMKSLIDQETKELEKSLKKVEDTSQIKKILGL